MSAFKALRRLEQIEDRFKAAKEFAKALGASESVFAEAEQKLKQLKDEVAKMASGGIVSDTDKP